MLSAGRMDAAERFWLQQFFFCLLFESYFCINFYYCYLLVCSRPRSSLLFLLFLLFVASFAPPSLLLLLLLVSSLPLLLRVSALSLSAARLRSLSVAAFVAAARRRAALHFCF